MTQNHIAIAGAAIAEHEAWLCRNTARNEYREWVHAYVCDAGDYFDRESCEPEDAQEYDRLKLIAKDAQRNLATARAKTRRKIRAYKAGIKQ